MTRPVLHDYFRSSAAYRVRIALALKEAIEQPQLVENLHRRGVDGVAAEIAKEVGMLFEHPNGDAGARKEQSDHHPCRAAADDEDVVSHGPVPRLRS